MTDVNPIRPLTDRLRKDVSAVKRNGKIAWAKGEPRTAQCLKAHLDGGLPCGLAFFEPGESTVRAACLDLDAHRGETSWSDMMSAAERIADALKTRDLHAVPFRSGGGAGIHLWLLWDEPQEAASVREALRQALARADFKDGPGGVAAGEVEIFPKQDSVPKGGFGNFVFLPLAGESVPLEPMLGMYPMPRDSEIDWQISQPVPLVERAQPRATERPEHVFGGDLARLDSALSTIEDVSEYDPWIRIGAAIHFETDGGAEGLALFDKHSARWTGYEAEGPNSPARRWASFKRESGPLANGRIILEMASAEGWSDPSILKEFPILPPVLRLISPATLQGVAVPPRRWIVPDWIPHGYTTGLYGDGGTGKSLLAMQLATALATGTKFCGMDVEQARVLGVFCEDNADELHRREDAINAASFLEFADLENVLWLPRVGQDNLLMIFENGVGKLRPFWKELRDAAKEFGARLVILDNAADMFGGNENDRSQVRQFVQGACTRLAEEIDGAVLLLAHPSRAGLNSGSGDSGSTGWNAAFRSRLYFDREKDDPDARTLSRMKSNYAAAGAEIRLRYFSGAFVPEGAGGAAEDGAARGKRAEQKFLELLDRMRSQGRFMSHKVRAGNYAPKAFAGCPDRDGLTKNDFEAAMERLFKRLEIRVDEATGADRKKYEVITIAAPAADEKV